MEEAPLWTPAWFAKGSGGRIRRLSVFTSITKQIEWLRGLGPVYLNTFPSNALALARHVALYPNEKPEILAILTAGEPLTTDVRRQCRTYLRCECIDILSNAEAGYIATQCTTGQSYHVQSELCRVEVLDQKGSPARPGQWGRLLITPLYNLAMPLIRYATGDYVRIASPCACGRYHQALELEVGRPNNLFKTRNGRWFRPDIDSSKIWPILGEDRWQLVQLAPAKFEFRYMAKEELGTEQTKALIKLFLPALPRGAKLRTRRHPALGLLSSGKFSNFMREPAFTDQ
jgi:phenylacetate-CoA ligase